MRAAKHLLAVIGVLILPNVAYSESNLSVLAKLVAISIEGNHDSCVMTLQQSRLLYDLDKMTEYQKKLTELAECQETAPEKSKSLLAKLRSSMKANGKSEALLKDLVLTQRKYLAMLGSGSITVAEAKKNSAILSGKGAAMVAELNW